VAKSRREANGNITTISGRVIQMYNNLRTANGGHAKGFYMGVLEIIEASERIVGEARGCSIDVVGTLGCSRTCEGTSHCRYHLQVLWMKATTGGGIPNKCPAFGTSATIPEPAPNGFRLFHKNAPCCWRGNRIHRVTALPQDGWHWSVWEGTLAWAPRELTGVGYGHCRVHGELEWMKPRRAVYL
jgi:hypothetical protein